MKEILIFAGTTEGRRLSEVLAASGIAHTLCVATQYGELVLNPHPLMKVHRGRMDCDEIKEFIRKDGFIAVVDATHPYAGRITENIQSAIQEMSLPYLRLKRDVGDAKGEEGISYFDTNEACAGALEQVKGNILLTTGSKELSQYCASAEIKSRLYIRVLPGVESITACMEQGIKGKQIIAMQGPFTAEMNEAVIHQYGIGCLVTKLSGRTGGCLEKLEAARRAGIPAFVIGPPKKEEGYSFPELCVALEKLCGRPIRMQGTLTIVLAGVGMGHRDSLTGEVQEAIAKADILLGADRMLAPYTPRLEKKPFYQPEQIIPYLKEIQEKTPSMECLNTVILFSGDSGFYSGSQPVHQALQKEVEEGRLRASLRIMPGISSVAYLASCIGESYQDADIYSLHGKELNNLARRIRGKQKTFLLLSGVKDVNRLGRILVRADMTECQVVAGYQLSYAQQQIHRLTPEECGKLEREGLYTCFIRNPDAVPVRLTHGTSDREFIRDTVPMTKEEVRDVSICKLKLYEGAIVYDIGSGTGSIAVELAGLSNEIQVYAIERNKEAVSLIERNKAKFHLENITVIERKAPEGLTELPPPTHAFIGGSGGSLKEILRALYDANPRMRVVINAVTMETICEWKEIVSLYPVEQEELIQMQVSRTRKAGQYRLMQAENPVWIGSFDFYER